MFEQSKSGERTLVVHLKLQDQRQALGLDEEFKELALSAGANIIGSISGKYDSPDPKYLIRKGKAQEICDYVKSNDIAIVLIDHALSPIQGRNLEKLLGCKVLDRTDLILAIFAQRARTFEGKLQVELAQLEHLSTKLVRGWTHLERQKGGIGLRGGPGETQLEVDKRLIQGRINYIKKDLEKVRQQRALSRRARNKAQIPTISLVGYTNTGKSTLFNTITGAHIYAANKLFATLDPTFRSISLPYVGKAILADTVGFIRDLPHSLIDAFQATLEETKDADLLLHVIDCHDEFWEDRKKQVELVLAEIGASRVPRLEVYNKIDLVEGLQEGLEIGDDGVISKVRISAVKEQGIDILLKAIAERLSSELIAVQLTLVAKQARERALLYDIGVVDTEEIDADGNWLLNIKIEEENWRKLCNQFEGLEDSLKK